MTKDVEHMNPIDSYEKFCKAFAGTSDEKKRAEQMLFLRDWLIRITEKAEQGSMDYNFDQMVLDGMYRNLLCRQKKDYLSRIVDNSVAAVGNISENLREDIIRENVKLPVYKVREINSYGLNWLSRQPGRTIKEKISSANSSMMAVQRRMTVDTGENRLYFAYLRALEELLLCKSECFPDSYLRIEEEEFASRISRVIRDPDFEEVRRWENMPPNNTLLSDQHYKVIWKNWNELRRIDEFIRDDDKYMSQRMCTVFLTEFLIHASRYFSFPQTPILARYEEFLVFVRCKLFFGVDQYGETLYLQHNRGDMKVRYKKASINLHFVDDSLQITVTGKKEKDFSLNENTFYDAVRFVLDRLGCRAETGSEENLQDKTERTIDPVVRTHSVAVDLFSIRPWFLTDDLTLRKMKARLLGQTHTLSREDGKEVYHLSCECSRAILLGELPDEHIETYTVATSVEDGSDHQMANLVYLLEKYIRAHTFIFMFPDAYNEFQLSLVYRAARLVFQEVRSFPRSVGIAFSYMNSPDFRKAFDANDFLLIADLTGEMICLTLLQGIYDDAVCSDIPESRGIMWERHPAAVFSVSDELQPLKDVLLRNGCMDSEAVYQLLGLNGILDERQSLAFLFNGKKSFRLTDQVCDTIRKVRLNITGKINDYLHRYRQVIHNGTVHIISLQRLFLYKGNCGIDYYNYEQALEGYKYFEKMQEKTSRPLWRDHLPRLAIKRLYGGFDLVNRETVTPEFHVKKQIRIDNTFTLKRGRKEYHFELVQNDASQKTNYAAVVKHAAFPLAQDTECRLEMTYQYGEEEPYQLLFRPIQKDAGFSEAKVVWKKITEYPYRGQVYPAGIPASKWTNLLSFYGKKGKINLAEKLIEKLDLIANGFYSIDVSCYKIQIKGKPGCRYFYVNQEMFGRPCRICFSENNFEESCKKRNQSGAGVETVDMNSLDFLTFYLSEERNASKKNRYSLNLSRAKTAYSTAIWSKNGIGFACYAWMNIDGKNQKVSFFENQFDDPKRFHPGITRVSFELECRDGRYKAVNIHNEEENTPYVEKKKYIAKFIRKGRRPGSALFDKWMYFLLITIYSGGNSVYDRECPQELRTVLEHSRDNWIRSYRECDESRGALRIFNYLSIAAVDVGDVYFELACELLEKYQYDYNKLTGMGMNANIGYALGDYTSAPQKKLFSRILKFSNEGIICILSKAIWGNENFIWNLPASVTLGYFEIAVDYADRLQKSIEQKEKTTDKKNALLKKNKSINWMNKTRLVMCLEYILGVFRLRKYGDDGIDWKLSLNNKKVRQLYEMVERMIVSKTEIFSFLKLDVKNKGELQSIPDLLYALLFYINGEEEEADISISGLNVNELDI